MTFVDKPDPPKASEMATLEATISPTDKEIVASAVTWASRLARGTLITESELEAQFHIQYPEVGDRKEMDRIRTHYVALRVAFDNKLLKEHKRALAQEGSTREWRILEAREHADRAEEILTTGMAKALKKATAVHRNTDKALLTAQELVRHQQMGSRIAHAKTAVANLATMARSTAEPPKGGRFAKLSK
jgi:hypothetical protein